MNYGCLDLRPAALCVGMAALTGTGGKRDLEHVSRFWVLGFRLNISGLALGFGSASYFKSSFTLLPTLAPHGTADIYK